MKFTTSIMSALLGAASIVSAVPLDSSNTLTRRQAVPDVTVQLANDQSGANWAATFAADGSVHSINALYGSAIWASSAQLVNFPQNIVCFFSDANWNVFADLTTQKTFVDLDGNPDVATPISLDGAFVYCHV